MEETKSGSSEENKLSESLAPNSFELITSGFKKPRGARFYFFAASAANFLGLDINSASETAFPDLFG